MGNELIDRDRLDQIIRRATELQTGEREIGEGLTEDDVIQLGADVGIPTRYLRQALLEDRTRGTRSQVRGAGQALVGPTTVEVNRVVLGDLHDVAEGVDQWMIEDEGLSTIRNTVRSSAGHLRWEKQRGFAAEIRRAFVRGGRALSLVKADDVTADIQQLEEGFCHVRLEANVERARSGRIGGGLALIAGGALATVVAGVLGFALPAALVPVVLGAAASIPVLRRHRFENERIEIGLEQVLDQLERSEVRPEHQLPGPSSTAVTIDRIAKEIKKAFGG